MKFPSVDMSSINSDEPFSNDYLNRKSVYDALKVLISYKADDTSLVISLSDNWGVGKTTFVKRAEAQFNNEDFPCLYIDAFKHDYSNDAFMPIAGAILEFVKNHNRNNKPLYRKLMASLKNVFIETTPVLAKMAVKVATVNVIETKDLDLSILKDVKDDISSGLSNYLGKVVSEKLSSYKKEADTVNKLQSLLQNLSEGLGFEYPLIVILDELDRCRPSFSVEILEKIKHFFSVPNIVFILVMNKQQMESSIKHIYGADIDAKTYLQKFITVDMGLPTQINTQIATIEAYTQELYEKYLEEIITYGDTQEIKNYVIGLAKFFQLSLRQVEKVFVNFTLVADGLQQRDCLFMLILVCFIKIANYEIFQEIQKSHFQSPYHMYQALKEISNLSTKKEEHQRLATGVDAWFLQDTKRSDVEYADMARRVEAIFFYNKNRTFYKILE